MKRNAQIDLLRGIAILLVLGVHFGFDPPEGTLAHCISSTWRRVGHVGVDLFFVLSGFLIGSLLISELQRHGRLNIGRFLIRRGFKLYPVYYLFIAYCIAMPALKAYLRHADVSSVLIQYASSFATSVVFLQNYIPPNPAAHTWSLAVEEHFYLILPFIIAGIGIKNRLIYLCLGSVLVCLLLRIFAVSYAQALHPIALGTQIDLAPTHLRFDALMLGVALALWVRKYPEQFAKCSNYAYGFVFIGFLLWMIAMLPQESVFFWGTLGITLRIVGSAAILLGVCHFNKLSTRRGLLAWIGANSYAIYVWHITIMGVTSNYLFPILHLDRMDNSNSRWLLMAGLVSIACVLAGSFVTFLIERPCLALRDRIFPSRGHSIGLHAGERAQQVRPRDIQLAPFAEH